MSVLTRRSAMLSTAGAITASLAATRGQASAGEDPVLTLYRQYRRLVTQRQPGTREHERLRNIMVARYGCPMEGGLEVADAWRRDPINDRMTEIDRALTASNDAETDLILELMETHPTTREGLRVKVDLMKKQMYDDLEDMDRMDTFPYLVLNDCLKILAEPTI